MPYDPPIKITLEPSIERKSRFDGPATITEAATSRVNFTIECGRTTLQKESRFDGNDTVKSLQSAWQHEITIWLATLEHSLNERAFRTSRVTISQSEGSWICTVVFDPKSAEIGRVVVDLSGVTDINLASSLALSRLRTMITYAQTHLLDGWPQ